MIGREGLTRRDQQAFKTHKALAGHASALLFSVAIYPVTSFLPISHHLDFARLYAISQHSAFFVIRARSNLKCRRVYSHHTDRSTGLICDQSVMLTGFYQCKDYPDKLRRVKYHDPATDKTLVFLTNNFSLPVNRRAIMTHFWG